MKHDRLTDDADVLDLYLREMGRAPLLSAEEELQLARQYEQGRSAQEQLDGQNVPDDLRAQLEADVATGQAARTHLIAANTRLVVNIAKRYRGLGLPFLDLIQEGNIGLIKAVEKFDSRRGRRFSTYAFWWIRQTVTRSLSDQSHIIRLPVHLGAAIRHAYQVSQQLEQDQRQQPTHEELAAKLGISATKMRRILGYSQHVLSLEEPLGDDEDTSLEHVIKDTTSPTPLDVTCSHELKATLEQMLNTLPAREADILRLRFGIDGPALSLREVGQKFDLSRERIRQIERDALSQLRRSKHRQQLTDYMT